MGERAPVILIHGEWLHASSWQYWFPALTAAGYTPMAPGWPCEPETVAAARARPDIAAGLGIAGITEHYARLLGGCERPPILIGHSLGGLVVQQLLGRGLAAAAIAISPAQMRGVLVLSPMQLVTALPFLIDPRNRRRALSLTSWQYRVGSGNAVSRAESDDLYARWSIPSPARPLFEVADANLNRRSPARVETGNGIRGPLLLMAGGQDRTVPASVTRGTCRQYRRSPAVTDLIQYPDRGHSLAIDGGRDLLIADALAWLTRNGL